VKKPSLSTVIKYAVAIGLWLCFALWYLVSNDVLHAGTKDIYRLVSDAFGVPGLLCLFAGLMIYLSNEGAFDGIGFILQYVFRSLIPGAQKMENYGTFRERSREKKITGFAFLPIIGAVLQVLSLVFTWLFYNAG
jgi:hypothetical protein